MISMNLSRRKFFGQTAAGAAALISIPAIVSSCVAPSSGEKSKKYSLFNKGNTVLFQGDSITDAGREKEKELPNNARSFGSGYAFIAASAMMNDLA